MSASGGGAAGRAYLRKVATMPGAYVVTHHSSVWSHSPSAHARPRRHSQHSFRMSPRPSVGPTKGALRPARRSPRGPCWASLGAPPAKCLISWAWTHWGFVHLCPWGHCCTHHLGSRFSLVVRAGPTRVISRATSHFRRPAAAAPDLTLGSTCLSSSFSLEPSAR